jgi:hypothetical protein
MSFYGLDNWPSAVIIADHKMLWRGHPDDLTDQTFDGLLGIPEVAN